MVLHSSKWLALSYFTYFFSYGIFLPFWSVWLKGIGLDSELIGLLLGLGLIARFFGSLLVALRIINYSFLIKAIRIFAVLTLVFTVSFWISHKLTWLIVVVVGFNLFFSPLVPLTDTLANIWQKQINMDYGRVRLWGSVAFVIGSVLTGKLVNIFNYNSILVLLNLGIVSMLFSMLIKPSIIPIIKEDCHKKENFNHSNSWYMLILKNWNFLLCICLIQGSHAAYYGFSAIYWQKSGYTSSDVGYLWSLGVIAEIVIFALSKKMFRKFNAYNLLLLSSLCSILRWSIMGYTVSLPWLILAQILHCGTFTICHLAFMCYIVERQSNEVIRLQAVYSSIVMGGSIALMTIFSGFLYQRIGQSVFWIMAIFVIPVTIIQLNNNSILK